MILLQRIFQRGCQRKIGYVSAAKELNRWIKAAGARTVIYATWAMKDQPGEQSRMDHVNRTLVEELNAIYAPVGENWWGYQRFYPQIEMYESDGAHASANGAEFAAKIIWTAIESDLTKRRLDRRELYDPARGDDWE